MIVKSASRPLQFEVRNLKSLGYDGLENDSVEAAYDTVNRMMLLMGDIPFGKLFTTPGCSFPCPAVFPICTPPDF